MDEQTEILLFRIRAMSEHMAETAGMMAAYGDRNNTPEANDHADELVGAAVIAAKWAEEIERDGGGKQE